MWFFNVRPESIITKKFNKNKKYDLLILPGGKKLHWKISKSMIFNTITYQAIKKKKMVKKNMPLEVMNLPTQSFDINPIDNF